MASHGNALFIPHLRIFDRHESRQLGRAGSRRGVPSPPHTPGTWNWASAVCIFQGTEEGMETLIGRSATGAFLVRRLLPAAVIVPIVLGVLRLEGERAGLYGMTFGVALMIAANVLIVSALILWSARLLDRMDDKNREAEAALRQTEEKYRGIFDNAAEGISQTSLNGSR